MAHAAMGIEDPVASPDAGDWGLNGPKAYVLPRFGVWMRSGLVVYPNGKAYDDQPQWLLDDFQTLLWRYNHWIEVDKPRR